MSDFIDSLTAENIAAVASGIAVAAGIIVAFVSMAGAMKAGVLKRVRIGSFEIESTSQDAQAFQDAYRKEVLEFGVSKQGDEEKAGNGVVPFEVHQLSNYYSQILSQSKISFWFSLIFASIGFAVIVSSAFLYKEGGGSATTFQFFSGVVVDAVAALFFYQSRNAQKSMGEFFDKLRKDRLQMESRNLCDMIENSNAQDALRVHLSLGYASVEDAKEIGNSITASCLAADSAATE